MQIRLIESGNILTEFDFYEKFHNVSFPQPLTNEVINEFGAEIIPDIPKEEPVPGSITRRQGRLALNARDLLEAVESDIENTEDPKIRRNKQIEYESYVWERNNVMLISTWASLGGTEEELDELFRLASTL